MSSIPQDIAVNATVALFTSRAQEYAALARQVLQFALGTTYARSQEGKATANAASLAQAAAVSSAFMLEISVGGTTKKPGGAGSYPSLVFDVALNSCDGFAQRIAYTLPSRETTHHTLAGYYTENYGIAPGTIDMDVEVVFGNGQVQAQVDSFINFLTAAKPRNPLLVSSATAPRVTLHDTYLGKSFYISQTSLGIEQSVEMLHRARLRLSATILGQASQSEAPALRQEPMFSQVSYDGVFTSSFGSSSG